MTKPTTKPTSSSQAMLTPGTYRLCEDLAPLRADKRKTTDWRYMPIKAGTLFFYKEWTYAPGDDETKTITEQHLYPIGSYEHDSVTPNESALTRQLEESLLPIADTPSRWLRREHGGNTALGVLDQLALAGKITLAEVQAATAAYYEILEEPAP